MRLPVAEFVRYRNADQDPTFNNREVKGAIWKVADDAPLWHGNDFAGSFLETGILQLDAARTIDPLVQGPVALAVILDGPEGQPDSRFQILIGWSELPTHEEALIDAGFLPVGRV